PSGGPVYARCGARAFGPARALSPEGEGRIHRRARTAHGEAAPGRPWPRTQVAARGPPTARRAQARARDVPAEVARAARGARGGIADPARELMRSPALSGVDASCSFCEKQRAEAGPIVAGGEASICGECLRQCGYILADDPSVWRGDGVKLRTPEE